MLFRSAKQYASFMDAEDILSAIDDHQLDTLRVLCNAICGEAELNGTAVLSSMVMGRSEPALKVMYMYSYVMMAYTMGLEDGMDSRIPDVFKDAFKENE